MGNGDALFQGAMCLLPKRWASMDHAPGPIIAMVAPNAASTIGIHGSLPLADAIHSSMAAIMVPMTGVHSPTRRSIPAQAAIICGIIDEEKGFPVKSKIPNRTSKMHVSTRCIRRPAPGHPLAKVEKSRCKIAPDPIVRKLRWDGNASKWETAILLLGETVQITVQ
jgi:hypothetical protein